MKPIRLGVNIDHVATLRNARGGVHPCPVKAALLAKEAGADGITAHLREDRRHIRDDDIIRLKEEVGLPLNFEMAATDEMLRIALKVKPNAVCLVPEKRTEVTTEGGLDVAGRMLELKRFIEPLKAADIRISLFIDAAPEQIKAAAQTGADIVELHTGKYCEAATLSPTLSLKGEGVPSTFRGRAREGVYNEGVITELSHLQQAAKQAASLGLECHAGHGLTFATVQAVARIPEIVELNIGHFLIGEAVFLGLREAVTQMKKRMQEARL